MAEDLIGIVGGTGLGEALADKLADARISVVDTPFGRPSSGIMMGRMGDKKIAFLNRHGDGHKLAPADVPFAANIFALKKLGARAVIASGAVGSLREEIAPKELVTVDQFIDKTFGRQSSFFSGVAAVHCEMSIPVCDRLRKKIFEAAADIDVKTHESGTYVCMEGPQFSTRAESLMHREWGGDLIGMTAMPEAKLAREAQMCYALIALASDYDCWRPHEPGKDKQTLLREIIGNLQEATANAIKLIEAVLQKSDRICDEDCPCRKALELAVWTTEQHIDAKDKEKLSVLFK
ncbi:MAG: MTAP family purine nucleoside phosphorylase [Planctomycetota bacterium]|jgi:5'-methylthioadenosine phosphorylase